MGTPLSRTEVPLPHAPAWIARFASTNKPALPRRGCSRERDMHAIIDRRHEIRSKPRSYPRSAASTRPGRRKLVAAVTRSAPAGRSGVIALILVNSFGRRPACSRPTANPINLLAAVVSLVIAPRALADDGAGPTASPPTTPPSLSARAASAVSVGVAVAGVAPLGSFLGGATFMGRIGWSPVPALRITAAAERVFGKLATAACECADTLCCTAADPSYTWLGLGIEGHATPRRVVDVYAGAQIGTVKRNAWRFAGRGEAGFDVRIDSLAFGPFAGLIAASPDSAWNQYYNYAFTAGLRVLVVAEL